MVGNNKVHARAPRALGRRKCARAGIDADHQTNARRCRALDYISAQIVAFANTVRHVEIGSQVVLQVEPGTDVSALLANRGLTFSREVRPNLLILQAADSHAAIDAAEALARENGVAASYPIMRRAYPPLVPMRAAGALVLVQTIHYIIHREGQSHG